MILFPNSLFQRSEIFAYSDSITSKLNVCCYEILHSSTVMGGKRMKIKHRGGTFSLYKKKNTLSFDKPFLRKLMEFYSCY